MLFLKTLSLPFNKPIITPYNQHNSNNKGIKVKFIFLFNEIIKRRESGTSEEYKSNLFLGSATIKKIIITNKINFSMNSDFITPLIIDIFIVV